MRIVIGIVLIVHGLIVAAQAPGSFKPTAGPIGLENPSWVSWWPTRLGQSWLLSWLGLERSPLAAIGGLLWLVSGIALLVAGLALFGLIIPLPWWRTLAIPGAAISLFMLVIYLHPLYSIAVALDIAILVALLWAHWPLP